jgi:hypothetical protein
MKYIQTLITMVVGSAVLAVGSNMVAQTVKPCVVTVVRIQGQARYSLGDNSWHPLVVGKVLGAGAIIQSAVNSSVDIVLSGSAVPMPQAAPSPDRIGFAPDPNVRGLVSYKPMVEQNVIRMWGNTVLAIDKLTQFDTGVQTVSDTELDLRAGRIFFNVKKMSATSQFLIKIPNGVAGIRGSAGFDDAVAGITMIIGSAVESKIINGVPFTNVVNAGFQSNPNGGAPISVPQGVMDNLMDTLTSLITLYQSPAGPSTVIGSDSTINCGSVVRTIQF